MTTRTVAVLVGSLRKGSFNRAIAEALAELSPPNVKYRFVEIGDLPYYNQDDEPNPSAEWVRFRDQIRSADAVLFVTPEYNRSVPAVLKNAIDVGSRPYGRSVFDGKPGAVVSVTAGGLGAFGANHHLRQSLVFLNVPTLQREAYISGAGTLFGENGELKEETRKFLADYAKAFADWIETIVRARTPEPA